MKYITKIENFLFESDSDSIQLYTKEDLKSIYDGLKKYWKKIFIVNWPKDNTNFEIAIPYKKYTKKNPRNKREIGKKHTFYLNLHLDNTYKEGFRLYITTVETNTDPKSKGHHIGPYSHADIMLANNFPTPKDIINAFSNKNKFQRLDIILTQEILKNIQSIGKDHLKYWDKRIENEPQIYGILKKHGFNHPFLDKKWKHLGNDFGLLDD